MIRLLIADDHTLLREGLKQLFSLTEDIIVVGEAANGEETLEVLRGNAIDLLLLDITMPGTSGIDLISNVRIEYPALPILVLSMHNEPQIARRLIKAGATGYITKDSALSMVVMAIRKIVAGGRFITPELADRIAFETSAYELPLPHERLSNRECHILRLLAQDKNMNEIAEILSISSKTVSTHKSRLMQKMGINSNSELLRYALAHKLAV
jgi:DNA-binding NarL/FixJ family response regulator